MGEQIGKMVGSIQALGDFKYPIAEEFHSLQGEGVWTGTAMKFIRLAGCNVGVLKNESGPQAVQPGEAYQATCTLWDGRKFNCDTNYQVHAHKSVKELLADVWENHVCITGGEPLIHDLHDLIFAAKTKGLMLHIETSGTKYPDWLLQIHKQRKKTDWLWVSCCPKHDKRAAYYDQVVRQADEVKLLVDKDFNLQDTPLWLMNRQNVFLQPVNFEKTVSSCNLQLCYDLIKQVPEWKLSFQLHKLIDWR